MPKILEILQDLHKNHQNSINDWFIDKYKKTESFIYNSVDIRYSGEKIAPVDTNIFPAGFNNLSKTALENAVEELKSYFAQYPKQITKILIFTEFHTRNLKYLENVNTIKNILRESGKEVFCASLAEDFNEKIILSDANNEQITLYPLQRKNDQIFIENDFIPDLIITNNDLTSGYPEILKNIQQTILPPLEMGWHKRSKFTHFETYNLLCQEFAKEFSLNPFLISTELGFCKKVNFKERKGIECIALETEKTLRRIKEKYNQFSIKTEPYVYIKANRGTYGMGIMHVKDAEEVLNLNKKHRNKMQTIKSNTQNAEILIQEGIETIDRYNDSPSEPFIYLIGGNPVGTILRTNKNRDAQNNLNSSGAEFFAADNITEFQDKFSAYFTIAKLAALSSSLEINDSI